MKKTISLLLIAVLLAASVVPVWADEYIDLDGVQYEEIIMPPWFTSGGLPYILEPYCIYLVYCNIFARFAE